MLSFLVPFISNKLNRGMKMKRILSLTLALLMLFASFALVSCREEDGEQKSFTFVVVHADGTSKAFEIETTRAYLGDALMDEELIAGENGPYGIYVKTVDGETLDYDKDAMYWSLYIGEDYAPTGADKTLIEDGATYSFKAENATAYAG